MVVRELITRLGFNTDDAAAKKYSNTVAGLKRGAVVAGGAVLAIGGYAIKAAADMEMLTTQFEVMLGSSEKAAALMDELKVFSATTPFSLESLADGTKNLLAFGVAEEEALTTMRMLGDAAGGNAQKLQTLVRAYGKVQAKGKGTLEELNMVTEAGVPIMDTLAANMGITTEEMLNMKGGVNVTKEQMTEAFRTMTSEGGIFFQGMLKQSQTFAGMISTMKDNFKLLAVSLGESLLPLMKDIVLMVTELLQGKLGVVLKNIVASLSPVLEQIGGVLDAVMSLLMPATEVLTVITGTISQLIAMLLKHLNPMFSILSGFISLIAKMMSAYLPPVLKLVDALLGIIGEVLDAVGSALLDTFEDLVEPYAEMIDALVEVLMELMPSIRIITLALTDLLVTIIPIFAEILLVLIPGITRALQLLARVLRAVMSVVNPVLELFRQFGQTVILAPLSKLIEQISELRNVVDWLFDIFDLFGDFLGKVLSKPINWVLDRIKDISGWVNSLPFIGEKIKDFQTQINEGAPETTQRPQLPDKPGTQTMLTQNNNINVTAPQGSAPGQTGLTPEGAATAMREAAHGVFTLELKRIVESTY